MQEQNTKKLTKLKRLQRLKYAEQHRSARKKTDRAKPLTHNHI